MRCLVVLVFMASVVVCVRAVSKHQADIEDNDFAEFEEFDEEEEPVVKDDVNERQKQPPPTSQGSNKQTPKEEDDEGIVEDEEDTEFEHFQDEEEFEGFDQEKPSPKAKDTPDLKITKVPLHFSTSWESFYLEMLMVVGLTVYFVNFCIGRSKNQTLANYWFQAHKELLEENFHLVGDDGKTEIENMGLIKQSESVYTLWCSGRTCCEGMLVELRLLKRQDLIHVLAHMFKPSCDQIIIKAFMNQEDMDSFVFALANKKTALKMGKEMADISTYCPEKKNVDKYGLSNSFVAFSEVGEVTSAMLDTKVTTVISKFEEYIEYIHFSDQFSGPKSQDESQAAKPPEVVKLIMFVFNIPKQSQSVPEPMKDMRQLINLVFYCMEKVKRFRLTKEAKTKTERSRLKVEEAFLKTTHAQRVEAAQQRRDEKRRLEKERILMEEDPEKQRRLEEKEYKRELKKRAPKMKQLKVKTM